MNRVYFFLMVTVFALLQIATRAQHADTTISKKDSAALMKAVDEHRKDSLKKNFKDPHKASIYSAILPGAGQVYNGKIWKVPIIYTALGISAYAYFYNKSWYDKCQYALAVATSGTTNQDSINAVDPKLLPLVQQGSSASNYIINYRNDFRKNQDYSALFFLLFWGLNIVDASVDAHLHSFNVSNDLSFKIKPTFMPIANAAGISLVFDLHKPKTKLIDIYQ